MEQNKLISYAMNFTSFLISRAEKINKIVLFGSVARNDFDNESDIDIFIDTNMGEKELANILYIYEKSEENKKYMLEGIKNKISLKTGSLDKWKLKRSLISDGILLYGKYEEMPKNAKSNTIFKISLGKMKRKDKMKIWRKLYGYKQKINNKTYYSKGIVEENNGKKLALGIFLIPNENNHKVISFLKNNKVDYQLKEVFAD